MTKIIQRHDTSTNWTSINPILALGEMGIETDTNKFKFGDGVTNWTALSYASADGGGGSGDYYTKEETDTLLDEKENKITTSLPLVLEEKLEAPIENIIVDKEANTFYATASGSYNLSSGSLVSNESNYIDIPYDPIADGSVVFTGPSGGMTGGAVNYASVAFGHKDTNGNFTPFYVLNPAESYTANGNRMWYISPEKVATLYTNAGNSTASSLISSTTAFFLYIPNQNKILTTESGVYYNSFTCYYTSSGVNANCFRIVLNNTSIYDLSTVGKYLTTGTNVRTEAQRVVDGALTNVFDLTEANMVNALGLQIDNQTIQVNSEGELVANLDELGNEVNTLSGRVTTLETNMGGVKIQKITQAEYDALATKDVDTMYLIVG